MVNNAQISPRGMVLRILSLADGEHLSVREIMTRVFEKYGRNLDLRTIVAAIDEGDYCTGIITERVERRGANKLPVKVFSIQLQIKTDEACSE